MILACALIAVIDGDTIRAECAGVEERIRLADIDAPERDDCPDEAEAAARHLRAILPSRFGMQAHYRDRYGRIVATIHAPEMVNSAMLASGHAKPWPHDRAGRPLTRRPKGC